MASAKRTKPAAHIKPPADQQPEPKLSVGAHPASIQALAKALAQLQKTAENATFPVEVSPKEDAHAAPKQARTAKGGEPVDFVEYALMSRNGAIRTSGRQASRLYSGAKDFF